MRHRDFDLNLLIALNALIEESNVSRAAQVLGITQPGMSHALAKLRKILGDPILVRNAQGMELTPFAHEITVPVRQLLNDAQELLKTNARFDPGKCTLQFNLLLEDAVQTAIGAQLYNTFTQLAPLATLHLVRRAELEDIKKGSVDLVIWHHPIESPYHHQKLMDTPYVTIARRPGAAQKSRMTIQEFARRRHAAVIFDDSEGRETENYIDAALASQGLEREVALKISSFIAATRIVEQTDLVATIPLMLADKYAAGAKLELYNPPINIAPIPIYMVWHQRTHHNEAYRWMRRIIADTIEEATQETFNKKIIAAN